MLALITPECAWAAADPSGASAPAPAVAKRTVTGVVVDAQDGEPLPGATISVVGDKSAVTATDIDGNFSITVSGKKPTLLVTYVGYNEMRVPVEDLGYVKVELKGADNTLDEVVVVGSGTQKRVSVTGAITSVKGDDLRLPAGNLTSALAGKIAGVVSSTRSGEPGSSAEFYIRGIGTFGGRQTPLILLDDVEISVSDLDYIPAENIESFSILKDASATAIYGSRGANGVMIVKTKGGDYNSQTKVRVSFENSFNFRGDFPEFLDGPSFMDLYNKARVARDNKPTYSSVAIERTRQGTNPYLYPNVDWSDLLFRSMAMRQRGNVNVSGGGSKVRYYMSLDIQHEDGLLNTSKNYSWNNNINIYNYTFQNNIAYKLTPTTTIEMNMNAQIRQSSGPNINNDAIVASSAGFFGYILTTNPVVFPVSYPQFPGDEFVRYGSISRAETRQANPYALLNSGYGQSNENTINTVIKLDQQLDFITKGLKFNAWVNFKNWSSSGFTRRVTPYYYMLNNDADSYQMLDGDGNPNLTADMLQVLQEGTIYLSETGPTRSSDQTFEFQANFNWQRKFGLHDVSAMLLYRQREYRSAILPERNQGFSIRATYDYAHRYLVEFNAGYNGTERLAKKDRFGFFPAASLGWVMSNEHWFEPASKVITNLKIRGSYGLVGSDDLASPGGSHFLYINKITGNNIKALGFYTGDYAQSTYQYGAGPELTYYALSGIGWEKSRKADIGVDLTLWGKLSIVADIFHEKRYDIFINRESWPQSLAYDISKPWANKGSMQNRGYEVAVEYNQRINHDWSVSFRGNVSYAENKILDWDDPDYVYTWKSNYRTNKPYPTISSQYGYIAEGLFTSEEEIAASPEQNVGTSTVRVGDIKYRDINGDGLVNSDDQTLISEYGTTPRLQYGFGATVNWRSFDFGFQFVGQAKRTIFANGVDPFYEGGNNTARNALKWVAENYFDPELKNFDAEYPRLGTTQTEVSNNTVASTWWMRDGSFLRLKNVELGWSFPYGRVYVAGTNLLRFSPFKLWDPELSSWNSYPLSKSVTVGVQITI
ncbi:MAG: TonB-dependent receptor [Prevotella sp.]|nr:TonB-dependent receptor [Bacteroides sp.]MCM1445227.1 TonB-dependent receptor [Prevotella sp.]